MMYVQTFIATSGLLWRDSRDKKLLPAQTLEVHASRDHREANEWVPGMDIDNSLRIVSYDIEREPFCFLTLIETLQCADN